MKMTESALLKLTEQADLTIMHIKFGDLERALMTSEEVKRRLSGAEPDDIGSIEFKGRPVVSWWHAATANRKSIDDAWLALKGAGATITPTSSLADAIRSLQTASQ